MADGTAYNILTEQLFTTRQGQHRKILSLAGSLAALSGSTIEDFTELRPHQRHAWHAFLVQLATVALDRANRQEPPTDAMEWENLLLALTDGSHEPWCLVVDDLAKPAFMQPPVPEGNLTKWKTITTPGDLDMLVTSKNHDVKIQLVAAPRPVHWIYALVTLQTMEGFSGRGNYGIARMNGGLASRPSISYAPAPDFSTCFHHDLPLVMARRATLQSAGYSYHTSGGKALLWLVPWDGTTQIALDSLDPDFIEVCRRVRAIAKKAGVIFVGAPSAAARLAAQELNGNTGDSWTPIDKQQLKSLTVPNTGFDYQLTTRLLLSGDFKRPACQAFLPHEKGKPMLFVANVMTRGQGKTEGLHSRTLPIPPEVSSLFDRPSHYDRLSRLAKDQIEIAATVRRKVLHPALCAVLQGGAEKLNFKEDRTQHWLGHLDEQIDKVFFEHLFENISRESDELLDSWRHKLIRMAERELDDAIESTPQPSIRRYRVINRAHALFHSCVKKQFPLIKREGANQ